MSHEKLLLIICILNNISPHTTPCLLSLIRLKYLSRYSFSTHGTPSKAHSKIKITLGPFSSDPTLLYLFLEYTFYRSSLQEPPLSRTNAFSFFTDLAIRSKQAAVTHNAGTSRKNGQQRNLYGSASSPTLHRTGR